LGGLGVVIVAIIAGVLRGEVPAPMLLIPLVMAAQGYFITRFLFDCADEVLLAGDELIVKKGSSQHRIPLSDVINVNYLGSRFPTIALTLRQPSSYGKEVVFR
jgi:hypothetical protein